MINIAIDASRCRSGGAIAHLKGILENANDIKTFNISTIYVFVSQELLKKMSPINGIKYLSSNLDNSNLLIKLHWQRYTLKNFLIKNKIDLLINADASSVCNFIPSITISQDLSSFEKSIINIEGLSLISLRNNIIKHLQINRLSKSIGNIFQTKYAQKTIYTYLKNTPSYKVLPHGLDENFHSIEIKEKKIKNTVNLIYISPIFAYKHQIEVYKAYKLLKLEHPERYFNLMFVGGIGSKKYAKSLKKEVNIDDSVTLYEFLDKQDLIELIGISDIAIFASECETFGITLLECMSAGIPIACASKSSLPETLKDNGVYFDPNSIMDIYSALNELLLNESLFYQYVQPAKNEANLYLWKNIANDFFKYVTDCYKVYNKTF